MRHPYERDDFEPVRAVFVPADPEQEPHTVTLLDELQITRIVGDAILHTRRVEDHRVWSSGESAEVNGRASAHGGHEVRGDAVITGDRMGELADVSDGLLGLFGIEVDEESRERSDERGRDQDEHGREDDALGL